MRTKQTSYKEGIPNTRLYLTKSCHINCIEDCICTLFFLMIVRCAIESYKDVMNCDSQDRLQKEKKHFAVQIHPV